MQTRPIILAAALVFTGAACNKDNASNRGQPKPEMPAPAAEQPAATPASGSQVDAILGAYERARALLAADKLDGIAIAAADIEKAARAASDLPSAHAPHVQQIGGAARDLGRAADLPSARRAFGELSRGVVAVVQSDPALERRLHIFECPMAGSYGGWVQPSAQIENPYMGPSMLECGAPAQPTKATSPAASPGKAGQADPPTADGHAGHRHEPSDPYYCPMHPEETANAPGATCPVCKMELVPRK